MQRHLIFGIFSYLAMTSFVLAQTATGVIRGTVQDPTGAVLIDVHVMLVDQARNQSWEQTTNAEGFFEFRALPFGNYRVELEHPGFTKAVIEDVALQVAQTKSLKVTLQVGSVNESIVVQADRGLLESSDASLSQVIDDKRLLGLPINGRNVMQLVSLSAGVINGGPCQCHSTPGQLRPRVLGRGAKRQHVRGPDRRHGNQRPGTQQLSTSDTATGLSGRIPCSDLQLLGGVWRQFWSCDQCGFEARLK